MKDIPQIPFIREIFADLPEEEIQEIERRTYKLCQWLQQEYKTQQLTKKDDAIE